MRNENKQHAFSQILNDMKTGVISGACLLCGTEQFLVNWAKDKLVEHYVNPATRIMDLVVFETGDFDMERFKEACDTLPLFSEKKVIILENFDVIWGKNVKGISPYSMEIDAVIRKLSGQTLLIITAGDKDVVQKDMPYQRKKTDTALFRTIKETGCIYDFESLSEKDLKKFIVKRLKGLGKVVSARAMDTLISSSGYFNKDIDYALYNLENDIKKIAALSEGEEITEEDVINGISDNIEHAVFKMLDSISQNRKETAFRLMNDMLLSGESPMRVLSVISGQLELMLQVKEGLTEGKNHKAVARSIGVHEFRVQKAARFCKRYSERELRRILINAFETDERIKSGVLDDKLALEMLIAEI